ncbi:hypothetical protein LP420_00070 [Massilia sp. B-10]|nr:hypothetical protein LP420_00070 [Massilia sp. B-10]
MQVGGTVSNEVVLVGGVKPGQTVVTARSVNLLKQGQKVKILPPERSASDPAPAMAAAQDGAGAAK